MSGEIIELLVEEGDSVRKDELLAQLRADNFKSALDRVVATVNTQRSNLAQTKARLAQSIAQFTRNEADHERNKKLFEDKVISNQDWDLVVANYEMAKADVAALKQTVEAARFTVKSAEANVADAQENLALTRIFAPINGIVTKLNVDKGESVVGTQQMQGQKFYALLI